MTSSESYHRTTCYDRLKMEGHSLDWPHQPALYKSYPNRHTINLPDIQGRYESKRWGLHYISSPQNKSPDFELLADILQLAYCHTAVTRHPNGRFYYRSAASAGALYPMELYIGSYGVEGLKPGIYHYDLMHRQLTVIREDNFRHDVMSASPEQCPPTPVATFFITGIFFRSAWKYRKRAYRYVLLDTGHLLQNLLFALNSERLPHFITYDFNDLHMNRLLEIDDTREVCLACVHLINPVGKSDAFKKAVKIPASNPELARASKTSSNEISYDDITGIHAAGNFESIPPQRPADVLQSPELKPAAWREIDKTQKTANELTYPEAVWMRRSKRNFVDHPLPYRRFVRLLDLFQAEFQKTPSSNNVYPSSVKIGFLANHIEGLKTGLYGYDLAGHRIGLVETGDFAPAMAHICLEQLWLKNAAVHFLFMSNFIQIDTVWGSRGYRYAMITAGRMGQLIYVGSTALGLGCCGIGAIFDYDAQNLLGLGPDTFLTYLVGVGPIKS